MKTLTWHFLIPQSLDEHALKNSVILELYDFYGMTELPTSYTYIRQIHRQNVLWQNFRHITSGESKRPVSKRP
jgi:hypothetical protein